MSSEIEIDMALAPQIDSSQPIPFQLQIDSSQPIPFQLQIDSSQPIPFQLQFDKPISSHVKFAVWNPEKDLLAMVTEDSKVVLHRFNWQRLWMASPGRLITSICWRPDGKAVTVGLEDGCIILYDVENGKLLKTIKSHNVSIVSLNWEEDKQGIKDDANILLTYEDRTTRFFPPPPRIPRMPGLCSGDVGLLDDFDDSFCELSIPSCRRLSILCSGDKAGNICFSIFGMFPIGRINIHELSISSPIGNKQMIYQMMNASLQKVALSKNLCQLLITSFGSLVEGSITSSNSPHTPQGAKADLGCRSLDIDESLFGLHSLVLDTSIFGKRRNEIRQVALQASSINELVEVSRASLSVMHKQWSDAMHMFHEKFSPLSSLITDHGLESNPQEEFLSFLFGARTSPPLHQFLVNVIGESGLKRVSKAVSGAGKELHLVLRDHLQPAAEIIGFRIGELRGLSRWHARYQGIGLDEKLVDKATEKAGMFLVQIERFLRVLATVLYMFQNFFNWLTRGTRQLMSEHSDQLSHYNSEHVVIFLKFHLDNDLVQQLLESGNNLVEVNLNTMNRVEELEQFGGFSDVKYLERTLAKEFGELVDSLKDAFSMPLTIISQKILCEGLLPLFPSASTMQIPTSVSYNEDDTDYICFQIPGNTFGISNGIGFIRGLKNCSHYGEAGESSSEAVMLHLPSGYNCVDIDLYKDGQIVLLLNEASTSSENICTSWMIMISSGDLPFSSVSMSTPLNAWNLHKLKEFAVMLNFEDSKRRSIPHLVEMPLAVSASRGVACVFAVRKRALVYILDEDEDEGSEME